MRALGIRLVSVATYNDDAETDHAVVSFGEPISSGYTLIQRGHLVNVTSLERWGSARQECNRSGGPAGSSDQPQLSQTLT